jgi:5-methylthioadenosine/S-adenosylhomocysteine deaminase
VHDPICNLLLGSGRADLGLLRRHAVPVALGTDGWSTGGAQDVLGQARVALGLRRPDEASEHWTAPADLWPALADHAALAVGLAGRVGTITAGARADLLLVDTVRAGWLDGADLVTQLVLGGLGAGLRRVLVAGADVLVGGRATLLDEERLAHDGARLAARLEQTPLDGATRALQRELAALEAPDGG